jgi:hypothetical protein
MRRYGRFVDARWIHQRMDATDARVQRETTRRQLASIVARLAAVSPVETDQAALIGLVREAQTLMARRAVTR